MYDPTVGRWMEEDPLLFEAGDANPYRYVRNDPMNRADPTGLADEVIGNLVAGGMFDTLGPVITKGRNYFLGNPKWPSRMEGGNDLNPPGADLVTRSGIPIKFYFRYGIDVPAPIWPGAVQIGWKAKSLFPTVALLYLELSLVQFLWTELRVDYNGPAPLQANRAAGKPDPARITSVEHFET
jgi:hypothetical protein